MECGYIKCSSAKVYYEIYGEGEPIVFLHGNGEDMSYFSPQVKSFKDKYKLILIDSRGHGKSSFGDEKLTLEIMSDDVIEVLDKLNINNANILGFSDGGNIALTMALKKPEVIKSLTLVGANLKPDDLTDESIEVINKEYIEARDEKEKEIIELMIFEPNIESESLRKIDLPVLVVAGENDLIKKSCTKLIASSIKSSELKIIKGGDHFLTSKMPEEFNHIFLEFINRYQ